MILTNNEYMQQDQTKPLRNLLTPKVFNYYKDINNNNPNFV